MSTSRNVLLLAVCVVALATGAWFAWQTFAGSSHSVLVQNDTANEILVYGLRNDLVTRYKFVGAGDTADIEVGGDDPPDTVQVVLDPPNSRDFPQNYDDIPSQTVSCAWTELDAVQRLVVESTSASCGDMVRR